MITPEEIKKQREELLDQLAEARGTIEIIRTLQTRCKHPTGRYCNYCGALSNAD